MTACLDLRKFKRIKQRVKKIVLFHISSTVTLIMHFKHEHSYSISNCPGTKSDLAAKFCGALPSVFSFDEAVGRSECDQFILLENILGISPPLYVSYLFLNQKCVNKDCVCSFAWFGLWVCYRRSQAQLGADVSHSGL